jgi:hypothetical protein
VTEAAKRSNPEILNYSELVLPQAVGDVDCSVGFENVCPYDKQAPQIPRPPPDPPSGWRRFWWLILMIALVASGAIGYLMG